MPALRLAGPGVGGLGKSRPAFSPPQWKAFPHSSHPLPSFTGSYIPACCCYTVNRSDEDPLGERAQEREKRLGEAGMQRPTGEAGAYSSERCGAKERMWIVDFPPWVVPSQGSHKGMATDAFLLLVWRGGKSHFLYLNLSQGKPKDPSDVCLPSYTPTCCSEVGSHCSSHLRNTPHPVLNPLRRMKNFGLFFALVS